MLPTPLNWPHVQPSRNIWQDAGGKLEYDEMEEDAAGDVVDSEKGKKDIASSSLPTYRTRYIATHKSSVISAAVTGDGAFAVTGSTDSSIKFIDCTKFSGQWGGGGVAIGEKPVLRTFYDHDAPVSALAFSNDASELIKTKKNIEHAFIASGARDGTVGLFDLSTDGIDVRRATSIYRDVAPIRCLSFHPGGAFLAVGTENSTLRLLNTTSFRAYTLPMSLTSPAMYGEISDVDFSGDGALLASCHYHGSVCLYDLESMKLARDIKESSEVLSISVSSDGKSFVVLLRNKKALLYDIKSKNPTRTFSGCTSRASFFQGRPGSSSEEHILTIGETGLTVLIYSVKSGELVQRTVSGHAFAIRELATSSLGLFITASEDHRARFWV